MGQNWRFSDEGDNYERVFVDLCKNCKYYRNHKSSSNDSSSLWVILFVVAFVGCIALYSFWKADEAKLQNCIYIDSNNSVHSVKNGQDSTLFNADYLKQIVENPTSSYY